ncbi:ATP-binding cassette domain-containing protein [Mariniblastus sp.]|nr:ATP-binding cassette domain-containing protein [Mariniblastus sp.]
MPNILDITHVDIYRGLKKVFDDLTLSIPAGQNTAIIGPNGAGKTTLLRTISRDVYPHLGKDGSLKIFGESHWNVWELRKRLGIVSLDLQQNFNPFTEGAGVVRTGFHASLANFTHHDFTPQQLAIADGLMDELGISELRDKNYLKMSTGEQRRFLLARALVTDPEALILDEPTTGLDLPAKFHYMQTIDRLIKKDKTVIVVTHHIDEIIPSIEHVVLLKSGSILAAGAKADVLTSENLTQLYDVPVQAVEEGGWYRALPFEL